MHGATFFDQFDEVHANDAPTPQEPAVVTVEAAAPEEIPAEAAAPVEVTEQITETETIQKGGEEDELKE